MVRDREDQLQSIQERLTEISAQIPELMGTVRALRVVEAAAWKLLQSDPEIDGVAPTKALEDALFALRPKCSECNRVLANEYDEGLCNTGACGCKTARSLCWYRWNGNKCLPYSKYDEQMKEV